MKILRMVGKPAAVLLLLSLAYWSASAPAAAYEDYIYNFSVKGPTGWNVLPASVVPGSFRFGWISKQATTDKSGASIAVFVQVYDEDHTARELLDKNVSVINGTAELKVDKRANLKIVKQQLITVDGKQGFILEVVGSGTGFAIGVPRDAKGKAAQSLSIVPTRQRWFCVVKGKQLIGVLSTCADATYKKYSPTFSATEASLKVR